MLEQPDKPVGTLLASFAWERSAPTSVLKGESSEYAEHHALLCGLAHVAPGELEALVAKIRCTAVQTPKPGTVSEAYAAVALTCFETFRRILQGKPQGCSLVQLVVAEHEGAQIFAGLSGLMETVTAENPQVLGQIVLVRPNTSVAELAQCLKTERNTSQDRVIRYTSGGRYLRRSRPIEEGAKRAESRCAFKEHGVYLVTGGLGGLGVLLAKEILRQTPSAKIILIGRTAPDNTKTEVLESLRRTGHVEYRQADITVAANVERLLVSIAKDHGGLNGIVHSAGVRLDNFVLKKNASQFGDVLAPKVAGTQHLDLASQAMDLDFFVLFSSIASWAGNIGQVDYAAANGFLNQFAEYRNALVAAGKRKGRTLAIAWPHWLDGGMHIDPTSMEVLRQKTGIGSLETKEGMEALQRCLSLPQSFILVMKGYTTADARQALEPKCVAPAQQVLTPVTKHVAVASTAGQGDLAGDTREFLRKQFSAVLKIPVQRIETRVPLEKYGIDSILAMNLTNQLEATFGVLAKTLFFEYQTIDDLADYFVRSHAQKLHNLFATVKTPLVIPAQPTQIMTTTAVVPHGFATNRRNRQRFLTTMPANAQLQPFVNGPIAIIGLSGRYPESTDLEAFWRNLRDGKDCIIEIPADRWDWRQYYNADCSKESTHSSKWGGFVAGVDEFDPQFFNISPREAARIDPQERMFLQHAWMALEDAGYSRKSLQIPSSNALPGQVGVYVGVMYGEYSAAGSLASIANRVSYALNLHGPSMTLETMCSSSLTAIHLACQDLRNRVTDLAIAGGVNLSVHPGKYGLLTDLRFAATDGRCQSFGEGGDGYVPGEGVGAVLLKRLADAERDGDAIHAIIRGGALNHGGKTNGYTVPNPQAQAAVIAQALTAAGVNPREISYLEAHGTGTKLGDPVEIAALNKVFQQHTRDTQFCLIGSSKSNIGHCESAAGIAGLTKVILQMRHRQIAPSLHSARLNPHIDFANSPFIVNQQLREWTAPVVDGRPVKRIAGLSSFGAGGSNAHFVIEEYIGAESSAAGNTENSPVIVPMSARTADQLTQKAHDLLAFLQAQSDAGRHVDLAGLAYTLQVGREAMDERLGFVAGSVTNLQEALRDYLDGDASSGVRGQARGHKETLELFVADSDFDETLNKWIAQRKLSKLLALWVKGFELDWQKFYADQKPRRMHVPTYPFAKEKYWIDPIKAPVQSSARSVLHPLLHDNTSDLEQLRFSSVFGGDEFFVRDGVLPSTVLLEVARAALTRAKGRLSEGAAMELRGLRFGEPLVIHGERALHVELHPAADDAIEFDIYSSDGGDRVHGQGVGVFLAPVTAERLDIDAIATRLRETPAPQGQARGARRVWRGERELLIAINADEGSVAQLGDYLLHPTLVQTVLDTAATELGAGAAPPYAIESLRIIFACTPSMRVWVRWHDEAANVWDMDWCDDSGNVCLRWRGVVLAGSAQTDQLASVDVSTQAVDAVSQSKPSTIALSDLTDVPTIADSVLPKPKASAIVTLDGVIPADSAASTDGAASAGKAASTSVPAQPAPTSAPAAVAPARTSSKPRGEDLRVYLKRRLAKALYIDEASIDNDRSFVDLGLDSIVAVEWVKQFNKELELSVTATRVYDYSSIDALGAYIESQLPAPDKISAPIGALTRLVPQTSSIAWPVLQRPTRAVPPRAENRRVERQDGQIAIIGMSGRYPDAENLSQFWRNLSEGKNSVKEIPPQRWDVNAYYDPSPGKPGKVYCKWLGLLDGIEHFDPLFFQISPAEAENMDPQHRLFMQESYRAFEDAGYSGAALSNSKCGVYLGIMSNEYLLLLQKQDPLNVEATGNSYAIGAARIAYHLNLKGPAIPIDTACSSSLVGIHLACQALLNHEIDMGLAGGVSLYLTAESYIGMCRAGMLSPEGRCKTFDNSANGFVPGEGVGAVVLKRLSDAQRDGDNIYGVIIGSGINQDGKTNGITAPSVNSQIELEREIYRKHRIDASSISYVETHGTGTKLGDPIELEALATVFKEHTDQRHFCGLGAVKTNIGHTSGAAGVAGVHKVLLCMQNKQLVPNLNIAQENALFDFDSSPFYISRNLREWHAPSGTKRRAAVSAFGFSGTNAHIVIEEYTPAVRAMSAPQTYVVPLSARSAAQLQNRAEDLLAFLTQDGAGIALRDLAYTLQAGRDAMRERCAWVVDSSEQLQTQLRAFLAGEARNVTWHRGSVVRTQDSARLAEQLASLRQREGTQQSASVAALWAQGAEIDWPSFYAGALPLRQHLPGYPFAKERYWIVPPGEAAGTIRTPETIAPQTAVAPEARQQTYYAPMWRSSSLPPRNAPFSRDDTLLVLDTDDRLFEQFKARLQTATSLKAIVSVQLASAYQQHAVDSFSVDARKPEHFETLLSALRAQGQTPTHVIHNLNPASLLLNDGFDQEPEQALLYSIDGLFALSKALVAGKARQAPCTFVSFFHATEARNTAPCAAVAAFYQSLALENNRYSGRVLMLDHEGIDAEQSAIDTATCITDEMQAHAPRETSVRYQASVAASAQRYVRVPVQVQVHPDQQGLAELPLKHRGVYLITGGLGGLGYLFSRHLAERYQARLVLSGRSSLNEKLQYKVEQLIALGAEVLYVSADIVDAQETHQLIASAKARFGCLNGVLHSAGITRDAWLIKKDRESLREVLAPKVQGTLHLDRATASEPLDLFVLSSSIAGSFGNAGQTDYAYANAFMDAFAEHRESCRARRQRFGKTVSIAWPFWQDGGMQLPPADLQRSEERAGVCALPTEIGLAYWETLLRSDLTRAIALYGYPSKIAAYYRPSAEPAAQASPPASTLDRDILRALTQQYLCELVQRETKISVEQIDIHERFEAFGFDSVMIGRFNATLEHDLGDLPKTLLYEYETVAELAEYLCGAAQAALSRKLQRGSATETTAPVAAPDRLPVPAEVPANVPAELSRTELIAIIGVHAHFPQAEDLHAFWEHLKAGNDLLQEVPESRWNSAQYFDADPAKAEQGKIYCKRGGFLDHFDKFDAPFFNISALEANIIDPQERLFLQSAWSAIEDAGYTRERLKQLYPKDRSDAKVASADVGVFVGVTTNSYHLLAPEAWQRGQMVTPSAMPWSIANRVSYVFDFQGPSMPVDTACSSSLVAVHLACEAIRRRECQIALAGGVNLYLHPAKYHSFCQRRMLAVGDHCRSYGAGGDGFIPGEGVGTFVLKPLHLAQRDGDHIYGVIRGSACDHSGRSNGYSTPNPNAQAQVISQALAQADVPARSISFIEGHGTGTQMGDSLEVVAITQAFGRQTADKQFCSLASVKANIGHAESATSIAGIAKVLLQFKHRQIAPSIHAETVNPDIDFARSPCFLQTQLAPWRAPEHFPRRALVNAFGAGGVNASAVIEEYVPAEPLIPSLANESYLFVLSAKDADRLRDYASQYVDFLGGDLQGNLASLCYTAQTGREAMSERLALLINSPTQLREALRQWLKFDPRTCVGSEWLWYGSQDPRRRSKQATREQRERMQAMCAARDLSGLAQLWTQGGDVDWQRLYNEPVARKVPLPSYPFARERYWITDIAQKTPAPAPATALSRLHPLISHNSSTLRQVSFDAMLAEDQYYARDHKVHGKAIFPGAGFIEMASVAATIAGQRRVRRLKDIAWAQPLAFDRGPQHAQVILSNVIGGGTEFSVVSFDDEHESVVHCEGRLMFDEGALIKPAPVSLASWRQHARRLAGSEHYQRLQRLGFEYGTAFQVVQEVSIGEGSALATLQLAPAQAADVEHYILHPCLIDGALQAVIALLATGDDATPHMPFAIDEIEILGSLTPRCYALVQGAADDRSRHVNILQFNVQILSESGKPLVKISKFYVRALPPAEPAHAAPGQRLTFGESR